MLTIEDAVAILGPGAELLGDEASFPDSLCTYSIEGGGSLALTDVAPPEAREMLPSALPDLLKTFDHMFSPNPTTKVDVGDGGVAGDAAGGQRIVFWKQRGTIYSLSLIPATADQQTLVDVASNVASRLE